MNRDLVNAALAGSAREPAPAAGELERVVPEAATPELRLLVLGAADGVFRRAGFLPPRNAAPAAADPEPRQPCSPAAAALLKPLLANRGPGTQAAVLREACELLAAADQPLQPELLPLALSRTEARVREVLLPLLGTRGRWLAGLRSDWAWGSNAAPAPNAEVDQVWKEGSAPARLSLLADLRRRDAERGRALLATTWKEEPAEQREALLAALATGLGPADEPLLELSLSDRAQGVRAAAARTLARLATSGLVQRMRARAAPLITRAPAAGLISRLRTAVGSAPALELVATLPAELDAAWERDGVARKPWAGWGERACWLARTLSLVDPVAWEEQFGAAPEAICPAAARNEEARALLVGLSEAALLFERKGWARPLLGALLDQPAGAQPPELLLRLAGLLPETDAPALVATLLDRPPTAPPLDELLDALPRPWPAPVAERVVAALRRHVQGLPGSAAPLEKAAWPRPLDLWLPVAEVVALRAPRRSFEALLAPLDHSAPSTEPLGTSWTGCWQTLRSTVETRNRLHQSIAPERSTP